MGGKEVKEQLFGGVFLQRVIEESLEEDRGGSVMGFFCVGEITVFKPRICWS